NNIWNFGLDLVDKESQKIWKEFTGTSWVLNANDKSDFTVICPWRNIFNKINP
ncbi:2834_t:CDS:1, partial [Cetraspora pellucida]